MLGGVRAIPGPAAGQDSWDAGHPPRPFWNFRRVARTASGGIGGYIGAQETHLKPCIARKTVLYAEVRLNSACSLGGYSLRLRGFGQWWLRLNSNFCSDDHISLGGLLSGFHPDHTDIGVHSDGEWYGEFQQRCDLVSRPVKHRFREQHWCIYANNNRNRNHYGHIHTGHSHSGSTAVTVTSQPTSGLNHTFMYLGPRLSLDAAYSYVATYWVNGAATVLPLPSGATGSSATGIAVSDGDVYVVGLRLSGQ